MILAGFWAVVAFRLGRLTMECCWGPPRGPVVDGPLPDLLDREWIPVLAASLLLLATGFVHSLASGHHTLEHEFEHHTAAQVNTESVDYKRDHGGFQE